MHLNRSFHRWAHAFGRAFRNRELEHEFRAVFRTSGVRFLELATTFTGIAFLAFFAIFVASRPGEPFTQPQPLRLGVAIVFLAVAALCRFGKSHVVRHYEPIGAATILVGIVSATWIGSMVPLSEGGVHSRLWGMYSTAVFTTCIIFGFTRLSLGTTLFLAAANLAIVIYAATAYQPERQALQRLVVHLAAVNAMCFVLYRIIELRERKLFLRAKRQRGINAIKRARDKAEEASRAKTVFLANMSHEIRTPMNGIIGSLALIERTESPLRRQQLLAVARQSADGLLRTLNEILDYAKLDAKGGTLHPTAFAPTLMCAAAVQTFQANAVAKGIQLTFACKGAASDDVYLLGDEEKLRRVVMNLVSNAVKFTTEGRVEIVISLHRRPGRMDLAVRVVDTGIGIPPEKVGLLFDPFYQVESSMSRTYSGTGLGLAISRQLVETMGGTIRVRSRPNIGSEFVVELALPIAQAPDRTPSQEVASGVGTPLTFPGRTALLVEDNEVNALISQASLDAIGLTVVHAADGAAAVARFQAQRFDIVLMDCQMPGMDGFTATAHMRRHESDEGRARTPILALTAYASNGDREMCLARGMDDHLSKPIDLTRLADCLSRWLPAQATDRPTEAKFPALH